MITNVKSNSNEGTFFASCISVVPLYKTEMFAAVIPLKLGFYAEIA